jgi:Uri superfamily endonuclease
VHARLKHHCGISASPHWHLDYLRPHAEVISAWYVADQRHEHHWAQLLESVSALEIAVSAFGSSDCACESHLFVSNTAVSTERMQKYLGENLISLSCNELLSS